MKTSEIVYLRLHGKTELYKSNYSNEELQNYVSSVLESDSKEAFIYFDNTWGGNAIRNALSIIEMSKGIQLIKI